MGMSHETFAKLYSAPLHLSSLSVTASFEKWVSKSMGRDVSSLPTIREIASPQSNFLNY